MKKIFLFFFGISILISSIHSQSVEVSFPHFAGHGYTFTAFSGSKQDTIASGQLDAFGKAQITLPNHLKDYKGMIRWSLISGGGLDFIMANEDNILISCPDAQPSDKNITYKNSRENTYLREYFRRQQNILAKINSMHMAIEAYTGNARLLPTFNTELQESELLYNRLNEETSSERLYAAHLVKVINVARGLPQKVSSDLKDIEIQLHEYVLDKLDMNVLYTSGYWDSVLEQFLNWYAYTEDNKRLLISDITKLLKRTESDDIYAAIAEKAIIFSEMHNMYDQQVQLAYFLMNDNRIKEPSGKVAAFYTLLKIGKGTKAPKLTQGVLPNKKIVLAFYDSSCGICTDQMNKLIELYPKLKTQGYEVISLSADSDKTSFNQYAEKLPWKDKFCDFEGFAGKDFQNYGIIGTPTFFLLDAKGIVQARFALIKDINDTI